MKMRKGWILLSLLTATVHAGGKHLFILSGQSNMARMNPELFTCHVKEALGEENVIVVHFAKGGRPIREWDKGWELMEGQDADRIGGMYDRLMAEVRPAMAGHTLSSVTFCWMQGERDARERISERYEESFRRVMDQLHKDLGVEKIHLVIGRLSDSKQDFGRNPHWDAIRDIQEKLAGTYGGIWVDTDDLNDGKDDRGNLLENDLHYSVEGYRRFGKRLADAAIGLVNGVGPAIQPGGESAMRDCF